MCLVFPELAVGILCVRRNESSVVNRLSTRRSSGGLQPKLVSGICALSILQLCSKDFDLIVFEFRVGFPVSCAQKNRHYCPLMLFSGAHFCRKPSNASP